MGVVTFQQLSELLSEGTAVLVDVRNPNELKDDGKIPGSHNVALPELAEAFQMTSSEFKEKYGFTLPSKESENLILTCRSGKRANTGKGQLEALGFSSIQVYEGSFLDWKAQGGTVE